MVNRAVFDLKQVETTSGGWTAIASTPVEDRQGEVVDAYAFEPLPDRVPVHLDHTFAAADLVGRARPYYDSLGVLHVDGTFAGTAKAQEVRDLIRDGFIDSMSVAFIHTRRETGSDGLPHVTSAELVAVDFVSVPALREATVVSVRGFNRSEEFEKRAALARLKTTMAALAGTQRTQETKTPAARTYRSAQVAFHQGGNLHGWPWQPMAKDLPAGAPPEENSEPIGTASPFYLDTSVTDVDVQQEPADVDLGSYRPHGPAPEAQSASSLTARLRRLEDLLGDRAAEPPSVA